MFLPRINIKKFSLLIVFLTLTALFITHHTKQNKTLFENKESALEEINLDPYSILLEYSNPNLNDDEYLLSLKDQTVYADTVSLGFIYENNHRYLAALIPNRNDKRILLRLECDETLLDYSSLTFSRLLLKADITKVSLLPVYETFESFDRKIICQNVTYDFLLEGKLSEVLYSEKI